MLGFVGWTTMRPVTLETRPIMFAGPMLRQRNPARSVESSVMPPALALGTPVVTVTLLGAGRCGRGSGRCAGCGGGAGGFCVNTGAAMRLRTAAAAHRRWDMTALVNMCFGCWNRAANELRREGAGR